MKKIMVATFIIIAVWLGFEYLYFYKGVLYIPNKNEVTYFAKSENGELWIKQQEEFEEFEIKGVNIGFGKPGYFSTERAVTKEEYLKWFEQIQEMGANVVRIYSIGSAEFYEALYLYNVDNADPLYLIQGVSVNDYLTNTIYSAIEEEFYEPLLEDCKAAIDVVHGRYKVYNGEEIYPDSYNYDISQWVYAFLLGGDWETGLVTYTDNSIDEIPQYNGTYLYTEDASNFEIFLASIGDEVIEYETRKYGSQRLIAYSNWPTTDPLEYEESIAIAFRKAAKIDVEHIKCKPEFLSGQFASYHVYPYYPDYYRYLEVHEENTYLEYLKNLNIHHEMPVVIAEFGVPASRGISSIENLGRNQGGISETEQGDILVTLYQDIIAAGSSGGIVTSWQDEWHKSTWNTLANVNLASVPYWCDYQTSEQHFGLLSFEPGAENAHCYVDGDMIDWEDENILLEQNDIKLSVKYDEGYIYFLVEQSGFDIMEDVLYIPIDTTPKSGSRRIGNLDIQVSNEADFVIQICGKEQSRVLVHEYYDIISALFYESVSPYNFFSKEFPQMDSDEFIPIQMLLNEEKYYKLKTLGSMDREQDELISFREFDSSNPYHYKVMQTYETGLLTYGNANPDAADFNSLADFCAGDGFVEIKIPWQLLNFADPSNMYIHDDYYEVYGVEYLKIDSMKVGAGTGDEEIQMVDFELEPLGKNPEYHERLKESYYILKEYWTGE